MTDDATRYVWLVGAPVYHKAHEQRLADGQTVETSLCNAMQAWRSWALMRVMTSDTEPTDMRRCAKCWPVCKE